MSIKVADSNEKETLATREVTYEHLDEIENWIQTLFDSNCIIYDLWDSAIEIINANNPDKIVEASVIIGRGKSIRCDLFGTLNGYSQALELIRPVNERYWAFIYDRIVRDLSDHLYHKNNEMPELTRASNAQHEVKEWSSIKLAANSENLLALTLSGTCAGLRGDVIGSRRYFRQALELVNYRPNMVRTIGTEMSASLRSMEGVELFYKLGIKQGYFGERDDPISMTALECHGNHDIFRELMGKEAENMYAAVSGRRFAEKEKNGLIILNTMPNCGSRFVQDHIARALQCEILGGSGGTFPNGKFIPEILNIFQTQEKLVMQKCHNHANLENIATLKDAGIKKIAIMTRDPRQVVVSWMNHLERHFGHAYLGKLRCDLPLDYESFITTEKNDWIAKKYFLNFVEFAESWWEVSQDERKKSNPDIEVYFSDHADLKRNGMSVVNSILRFFGFSKKVLTIEKKGGSVHGFRKASSNEFQKVLSQEVQNWMWSEMQNSPKRRAVCNFFGWIENPDEIELK